MDTYEVSLLTRDGLEVILLRRKELVGGAVAKKQSALSMLNEALTGRASSVDMPEEFGVEILYKCPNVCGHSWSRLGEMLASYNADNLTIWRFGEWNTPRLEHVAEGSIKCVLWSTTSRYISVTSSSSPGKKTLDIIDLSKNGGSRIVSSQSTAKSTGTLQFGPEDVFAVKIDANSYTVYDLSSTELSHFTMEQYGITNLAIAPSRAPDGRYYIALVGSEIDSEATAVRILRLNLTTREVDVTCVKQIYHIEETTLEWNIAGQFLLAKMHTDIDRAGKSYYGRSSLYMLSIDGQISTIIPHYEGPVHSFCWSPTIDREFAVVSGSLPTQMRLFDAKYADGYASLGTNRRNTIFYSRNGDMICTAGFGNLPGDMDVWHLNSGKMVGATKTPWVVDCDFSPDSAWILCATTTPRLRVDNGIRILRATGEIALTRPANELYKAYWRPTQMQSLPINPNPNEEILKSRETTKILPYTTDTRVPNRQNLSASNQRPGSPPGLVPRPGKEAPIGRQIRQVLPLGVRPVYPPGLVVRPDAAKNKLNKKPTK